MTAGRSVLCYIHGEDQQWEAICVDFDISVEGTSEFEARAALRDAINSYCEAVLQEEPSERRHLWLRRAPFHVRLGLRLKLLAYTLFGRVEAGASQGVFGVPCPA